MNLGGLEIHISLLKLEVYGKVCIVRNFYGEEWNDISYMQKSNSRKLLMIWLCGFVIASKMNGEHNHISALKMQI